MPVFTSIGAAIIGAGLITASATVTAFGVGAVVVGALAVGAAGYALAGGFDSNDGGGGDSRIQAAASGTGQLTPAEAKTASKKRAYRKGILFTSPTGLDSKENTSSAKLK
jgi:hypothetical protein